MKKIAVLTSGGDSPGMNAAIRAVVRCGIYNKLEVVGIMRGYQGLIENDIIDLPSHSVSNIIQQGGTMLQSARSTEFMTKEGRLTAYENLKQKEIDGLVVIGGNGTFTGAWIFSKEFDFPVVGVPGTIDNDIYGTDYTIGFDTALNTVVDAVDKIRDTATAHNRLFFIEVMGRDAGFLAIQSAIASGAEAVLTPEIESDIENLYAFLNNGCKNKKKSSIVIVAEGDEVGGAINIANKVSAEFPMYDVRMSILGHIQRGGAPSTHDRVLASELGVASVQALINGDRNIMVGVTDKQVVKVPFDDAIHKKKPLDPLHTELLNILSI
ncbi:MAG: 6-phosphofructokinase [Marinilabiliaceae bacterium]|nr:6-phosphofructokinase [Marinilabiliaceae bacterium]